MISLAADLKATKNDINQFYTTASRALNHMNNVIDDKSSFGDYIICSSTTAGTTKTIRPFNENLFIQDIHEFEKSFAEFRQLMKKLAETRGSFKISDALLIDRVVYTLQQAVGIGFDLLVSPNSARKHVGNRLEELVRILFSLLHIPLKKVTLKIPYETNTGIEYYRCETDVIISPFNSVKSTSQDIHPKEIIISLKTTTKDRMPKIFTDKILLEKFLQHPVRVLGISQNDVQRKDSNGDRKISFTFVSNLFMVYTKFLTKLEGYYYLDIPKKAKEYPFNQYISPFSQLVTKDLWELLVA